MSKTVLITGGTGLIGQVITNQLVKNGHNVHILTRDDRESTTQIQYFHWDVKNKSIQADAFTGITHAIHLAGASIAKRWTDDFKQTIIDSRVKTAAFLFEKMKEHEVKLEAFVSASASGYYLANTGALQTEEDTAGNNFLSTVCKAWEQAAEPFHELAERVVIHRIGVVLDKDGGALEKMLPPFQFHLAPYFGNGNMFYPWVHIEDVANQFVHAVETPISGVFNANTGNVTQKELNKAIATAMNKNVLHVPTPIIALKLALGDMHQIVTDSLQMSPSKIRTTGFEPRFAELLPALQDIVG